MGHCETLGGHLTIIPLNKWVKVMQEEVRSLLENHTYDLVKLSQGKKVLKNKWVYRLKTEHNGSQLRYKAQLVVKGIRRKVLTLKKSSL